MISACESHQCVRHSPAFLLIFLLIVPCLISADVLAMTTTVMGKAYRLDNEQLVYTEEHSYLPGQRKNVVYKKIDGSIFANKFLVDGITPVAPEFRQKNSLNGETIGLTRSETNSHIILIYKKNFKASEKKKSIEIDASTVIDAGFDTFVRQNWSALATETAIQFKYLVPSRLSTVKLYIQKQTCEASDRVCYKISAKNWLIALLSKPIFLEYDMQKKRLLRFTGTSNISDEMGKYQDVDIHYTYFREPLK